MTVLLVTEVIPPRTGGSGRWFWEIYRRLPREQVVIAAGEDPRQDEFDRSHDLNLLRMPLAFSTWGVASPAGLRQYVAAARRLRRLARANGVTAIHAGKCLPEGLLGWFLRKWCGLPYLCYVHGEELNLASLSRELGFLTQRVLRGAEIVIANSRNTERILREEWHLPGEHVRVLHPGVDTERFVPAERDPEERAKLGWFDRPVVLTVGRLQKRKGHDMMIRALGAVRQSIPDVLFAIAGDGEERPSLQEMVALEGVAANVQFLGEVDEGRLLTCYQQCDLFALPNRQVGKDIEGFGMVLLEAQACGKPVVAGDSGGTAETMRPGETGFVVPCDTPERLAELAAELLRDRPRVAHMGEAARAWVVERFDWASLTRQAARLFGMAVAAEKPSAVCGVVHP